ncbi:DUF3472 domain-containing protein [Salmonirosea aquatica]|uniref:DUF3472 domain-containing protein n=1 Tax=Salmonirosea aquatica TaxID=2654236 RepID=A0A7C9FB05_9BACT|nr:DUF3472 domain-containing protein [Cytophagaceae bacterium SJW1-29]
MLKNSFALSTLLILFQTRSVLSAPAEGERLEVPLGGNSWITGGNHEHITKEGLLDWSSSKAVLATYVRIARPGQLTLRLVASSQGTSHIRVTVLGKAVDKALRAGQAVENPLGTWEVRAPGYVKIELQGRSKTAPAYGQPTAWVLEGSAVNEATAFVKNNEGNFFYWGRRGPSVHLTYPTPTNSDVEWFYNEVTVPQGQDVIGSYFMANGFAEGYFGMQVNSTTERRILFSVWSPYKTDDPKSIPEDQKIRMLRKGKDVYTGEFGNEGAGGQSYLKYNWRAGNTYRFLLQGTPSGDSTTTYTAYFYAPEQGTWQLVASFRRPHTHTYLKRLHSFLENFIPDTGDTGRRVYFGNQWVKGTSGAWKELTEARFTADATARKGYRMDYAGGRENQRFFLQNCGFFADYTDIGKELERKASGQAPVLDLEKLP